MSLAVITTHFNPSGYKKPLENFKVFRDKLDVACFVVEASYDWKHKFHCATQGQDLRIFGNEDNRYIWQRERLVNHLAAQLQLFDQIAWIDADIVFTNPNWYFETSRLLDEYPFVQMFEHVEFLNEGFSKPSWAYQLQNGKNPLTNPGHTGYAWAANLDALPNLFERMPFGGSDRLMAQSFSRVYGDMGYLSTATKNCYETWDSQVAEGGVGCTSGAIQHLYHGDRKNRRYTDRYSVLKLRDFDPNELILDQNGLFKFSNGVHPDIKRYAKFYFDGRLEDETTA